jgi:nitrite reductase/ring-hydroxylating ferredoxin subunit
MTKLDTPREQSDATRATSCSECAAAVASRRAFLREIGFVVVGALALSAAGRPEALLAESVREIAAERRRGALRTYALPTTDSISTDATNDVIIARWQNRVYAFSLKCPHRGTRLEWLADERRVFCPKHKARFTPDGAHDSGRGSRDLDRYDIARQGTSLVVNLDALRRADQEPQEWRSAVVVLA